MKIAIIRSLFLNKFEMQNYEPLLKEHGITAYSSVHPRHDLSTIKIPIKKLLSYNEILSSHSKSQFINNFLVKRLIGCHHGLIGLEKELKNKQIYHAAETYFGFSYQAIKAKLKYGGKVVLTCWENIPFQFEKDYGKIKQKVKENTNLFIAITERAKQALILEGVKEDKIKVISAGVDLKRFKPQKKETALMKRIRISPQDFIILFIGQHELRKGVFDLIFAAKKILSDPELKHLPIRFIFIGEGSKKEEMKTLIKLLRIEKNCLFLSNVHYQEIHRLHSLADIFVLPSIPVAGWQEQFGMVLAENMACGKAVISTLSGSIPEVVGNAGILVQPNDFVSLYMAIKKLTLDKKLRAKLDIRARERAIKKFDSRKIAKRINEVYKQLI